MGVILALVKMLGVNLLDLKRGVMWDGRQQTKIRIVSTARPVARNWFCDRLFQEEASMV